jgi:hypothetical protein
LRGNVEDIHPHCNRIDPLKIVPAWRDPFPKMCLDGNYIDDGLPLNVYEPAQTFLKVGATYCLLGATSTPDLHYEHPDWTSDPSIVRVVVKTTSDLYQALCSPTDDGTCNFSMEVQLTVNLACNPSGLECDIDQPHVLELEGHTVFFEYIKSLCTQFPFYENGLTIKDASGFPRTNDVDVEQ